MSHSSPLLRRLISFLAFLLFATLTSAQSTTTTSSSGAKPTIQDISSKYKYQGCYNETTGIPGTSGARALDGGINEVLGGNMTVQICLAYCNNGGMTYKYAGLEFSRECWCAQHLSSLATKLPDSDCDLACDGDTASVCGGSLKLTVYAISSGAAATRAAYAAGVLALAGGVLFSLL